eukprot:8775650-Pyramimonas_sp.AAC.1
MSANCALSFWALHIYWVVRWKLFALVSIGCALVVDGHALGKMAFAPGTRVVAVIYVELCDAW